MRTVLAKLVNESREALTVDKLQNRTAFLALTTIRGVGYWTLFRMAKEGVNFAEFVAQDDSALVGASLRKYGARLESSSAAEWRDVRERAIDRALRLHDELAALRIRLLMANEDEFPSSLHDLSDAPAWIFLQGDADVLRQPSITVVGTREPSEDGLWLARFVGHCLEHWRVPTVSGLALGVDQIVHEMSLRARVPTIAVLGTGISSDYPRGSAALRAKIVDQGGAIVTEYLPRETYSAENFVRRNRIQAALGRVLIPVEWAQKSGTAHTVRYAGSLNRAIAGLRLPDWAESRVIFGASTKAETFTIPGQEQEFRSYVARRLTEAPRSGPTQLSFI